MSLVKCLLDIKYGKTEGGENDEEQYKSIGSPFYNYSNL